MKNPKHEILSPKESQMTKIRMLKTTFCLGQFCILSLRILDLFRISGLGFRIRKPEAGS